MRVFVCVHMCACVHLLHPLMDMQAVRACMHVCALVYHICFISSSTDGHEGGVCVCVQMCVTCVYVRVPPLLHPLVH